MAMKPISFVDPSGNRMARLAVPNSVWDPAVEVGHYYARLVSQQKISDERAGALGMNVLLKAIAELFEDGDAKWLGDTTFQRVIEKLCEGNFGTLPSQTAGRIDINKLHRSNKLKSGFIGVYVGGNGFRAMGRDHAGKQIVIGSFQTSEEAAYRRWLYYKTNNLPYGELEAEMVRCRNDLGWGAQGLSDEQLIQSIKVSLRDAGRWDDVFGPLCCTIEPVYSSKLPNRDYIVGAPIAQKALPMPEEVVVVGFEDGDLPPGLL